jgi:hypothetical protein
VGFDQTGQLWVTSRGVQAGGSRNILNDPDYFVRVDPGAWYGWPDFFDGRPVTDDRFLVPGKPQAGFLWAAHPRLSKAFLTFPPSATTGGFAFSPGGAFGFEGDAFLKYPVDVVFGPVSGLYLVDRGIVKMTDQGPKFETGTGAVWRIYPTNGRASRAGGALVVEPPNPTLQSKNPAATRETALSLILSAPPLLILIPGGLTIALVLIALACQSIRAR